MPESLCNRHPLGDRWLGEVDELVEFVRGREIGRFHIEEAARRTETRLELRPLEPSLLGLTLDREQVLINSALSGSLAAFTFAHELGHVYRRRGYFGGLRRAEEEWFADWFAREMLFPRSWLARDWHASQLAALHIDSVTVALQLSVIGKAPPLMRAGGKVLCRTCGSRHHRWGCGCAAYRGHSRFHIESLPEVPRLRWNFKPMGRQLSLLHAGEIRPISIVAPS